MRALLEALRPGPGPVASLALLSTWAAALVIAAAGILVLALPPPDWAVRACPNMLVTARFPAEPQAAMEMVDGRRADICTAMAAGVGVVGVTRVDLGTTLDRASRVASWPMLASPDAVERIIDGRDTIDVPLTDEQVLIRFVFDGPIVYVHRPRWRRVGRTSGSRLVAPPRPPVTASAREG